MLYEIYEVRKSSYSILRSRKESLEDFVTEFLKTKVMEIWPNGWMKYEDLKKELARREKKLREDPHHKSHNNNNNNLNNNNDKQTKPIETVQQSKPTSSISPPAAAQKPISLDVTSPARRTDHSIISIMSLTSPSPSSSKNHSQNDVPATCEVKTEVVESVNRRNSSGSDSDGVEIVGVYSAPSLPKKSSLLNNILNKQRSVNKSRSNSPLSLKKQPVDIEAQIDSNCSFKGLMTALKDLDVIDLS